MQRASSVRVLVKRLPTWGLFPRPRDIFSWWLQLSRGSKAFLFTPLNHINEASQKVASVIKKCGARMALDTAGKVLVVRNRENLWMLERRLEIGRQSGCVEKYFVYYHFCAVILPWILVKLYLISMFHLAFFNSVVDKHQHMPFFTFNTVLV